MFPQHTLKVLDFFPLLEAVAREAASEPGRREVLGLRPWGDPSTAQKIMAEVGEALILEGEGAFPNLGDLKDIEPILEKSRPQEAVLAPHELLAIRGQLALADRIKEQLSAREKSPLLTAKASKLHPLKELRERLEEVLGPFGEILDTASVPLTQIRRQGEGVKATIRDKLQALLFNPALSKTFQEKTATMKNGRFVLPVRAQFAGRVKGLVQDQSGSGSTLYIEPFSIVELNNRLIRLYKEEEKEVEHILRVSTAQVQGHRGGLKGNQYTLAYLDSLGARARFARKYQGSIPRLVVDTPWRLIEARHPLLIKDKGIKNTVPLEVGLGKSHGPDKDGSATHSLVITGPNTGGKTVALKTMGLLALMVQSGIPPTAHPDSCFPIFSKILADIGDEQSIQQNLSTFSAHMKNIKEILDNADSRSLVVLDELGAGTDPWEGAPLAMAILEELHQRGAWCLVSTHHNELKLFAHAIPGMRNASVEFDPNSLSPTYRLLVGVPGRSNALVVAEKLGIPPSLIQRAQSFQEKERWEIERVIAQLEEETQKVQRARESLEQERKKQAEEVKHFKEAKETLLREQEERLAQGKRLLAFLHKEVKRLSKELKKGNIQEVQNRLKELEGEMAILETTEERGEVQVGDTVRVWGLGLEGRVLSLNGGKTEVDTGKMKVMVPSEKLSLIEKGGEEPPKPSPPPPSSTFYYQGKSSASMEINILGKRVEEALPIMERFLDEAYLAGLREVRIVHGVGTGTLKKAVREALSTSPMVDSYEEPPQKEGGAGATIVKLKGE
jgi:DNA mismatch repair protein MutS2